MKDKDDKEFKLEFTVICSRTKEGYHIAQIKELPCIVVQSEGKTHLMQKLLECLAGYTLAIPYGDIPVELVQ